jgi:hypothetical protein
VSKSVFASSTMPAQPQRYVTNSPRHCVGSRTRRPLADAYHSKSCEGCGKRQLLQAKRCGAWSAPQTVSACSSAKHSKLRRLNPPETRHLQSRGDGVPTRVHTSCGMETMPTITRQVCERKTAVFNGCSLVDSPTGMLQCIVQGFQRTFAQHVRNGICSTWIVDT